MRGQNKVNMVGQKFGRLLIISSAYSKDGRAYWNCLCDCGTACTAMGKWVRQGKKKSCGCLQREAGQANARLMHAANTLPSGVAAFNLLFASYRSSAEARGINFNLTKEAFKKLTKQSCFYCGAQPTRIYLPDLMSGGYAHNGIDRKDSSFGYDLKNCVACCKTCNWMKNTLSIESFVSQCSRIAIHQATK